MVSKLQLIAPKTLVKYLKQHGIVLVSINKIKTMPKIHLKTSPLRSLRTLLVVIASISMVGGSVFVHADTYQAQIDALQNQNASALGVLNGLMDQAGSYQSAINQLQTQINAVQAQINANQARQASLEQQLADAQAQIDQKRLELGAIIKAMYIDGQITTIEQLATSNNLSDYVDKQIYRQTVQNQLNAMIEQIKQLQIQLQKQKTELDTLIASQKAQQQQLASTEYQQNQMLSYNQSQQSNYNSQIAANTSQIAELRRLQIIANNKYNIGNFRGDPGNGGYPSEWANAYQDSMIDDWGMYNRECVSYTAYRVHQDFLLGKNTRDMPWWGGFGNAKQWDDNAMAAGIPVDSNPTPGSIAISNYGFYGHAMYVEAVNGNEIYVQQYNQQLNGQYSEGWRYTTGLVFIHF